MEDNSLKNGISYKIKIPIIILTLVTMCAMGALFIKIAYSVTSSEKQSDNYQYLINIGDKLKNKGLYEQAIDQYIKYLEKTNINTDSHTKVAHTVGELYIELSNCREGLVWLFQAEESKTPYNRTNDLKKHIDLCLAKVNTPKPSNLNIK